MGMNASSQLIEGLSEKAVFIVVPPSPVRLFVSIALLVSGAGKQGACRSGEWRGRGPNWLRPKGFALFRAPGLTVPPPSGRRCYPAGTMSLGVGSHVGAYEITGLLGSGGMGDVYRAHDGKLQRDVALKVLSARLASTAEARARFEREALSIAKLSHPNIVSIYEFGDHSGLAYVASELIEGETLRARLEGGPLPQRRAVAYALQIARGVAAAHARGIVHRDLKPENVMITRDDHVKILDFGLAKPMEPAASDETRVAGTLTSAGIVLGTFAYMAPEQVRGLAVDHRADIFAFGALLYEMLSGVRAFKGETAADTMTAILTKEPPELDMARLAISPAIDRIVRRCLEKSADMRFQSATDLAFALETLSTTSTASSPQIAAVSPARRDPLRIAWLPWSLALVALVAAVAIWLYKPATPEPELPWQHFTRLTEAAGVEASPALSPDGSTVAYAMYVNGGWDIYAQRVGGRNPTPIVNDVKRNEGAPAYSPDGSLIAFHESDDDGGVFIAGATGESVRRLTDIGFDPAWSPDGTKMAFTTEEVRDPSSRQTFSTLYVVDVAGGAPRKIVEGDAIQPSWSPSGDRIVYWSNNGGQRDIFTVAASGGARVPVTEDAALDWSPVWFPDGRFVYFSSDRGGAMNLWRIAVDQANGRVAGVPLPVTTGVQASATEPRFSRDGKRLAFRSRIASVNPVAIPFDPVTGRAGVPVILDRSNNVRIPSDVSPDGTQIAYYSIGELQEDVFIGTANGKGIRHVTDDSPRDRGPVFTHDGQALVFYSNRDGSWGIWTVRPDGSNLRKLGSIPGGGAYPVASPKDDTIVFSGTFSTGGVFSVTLAGGGEPALLPSTKSSTGYFFVTSWSKDGARLCGPLVSESGRAYGIGVYDLQSREITTIANDEAFGVRWLPDGRRVVYFKVGQPELVIVDSVTHQRSIVPVQLPGPPTNDIFSISPDGRTIYYGAVHEQADIWIAERK
jgi:serine/threonine protein kinase/Tol biopolymer transport system component